MARQRPPGRARADPALRRQLAAAGERGEVEAVCALRAPTGAGGPATPTATAARVRRLLRSLARETGLAPRDWHVFGHLDRFVVAAPAGFVRALLGRAEVASAMANRPAPGARAGPALRPTPTPPRGRRRASLSRPTGRPRPRRGSGA